jgi:hypothetical protein
MMNFQLSTDVDIAIEELVRCKDQWIQVPITERVVYLNRCIDGVTDVAAFWVEVCCRAKGIDPASTLAGEEWLAGPASVLANLRHLIKSLNAGGQPQPVKLTTRSTQQFVAQIFPDNWMDRLMLWGMHGELWLTPGKPATQGLVYRQKPAEGKVALVLGAGNISSVAPTDMLYKLFAEDQVVLLKMNPVNEYLGKWFEQAFQPLIADGFLKIVYGGAEVGRYLCHHSAIDTIHITGSHRTHDAIVWGSTFEEQQHRQQNNNPVITKPITSELGCVTPVLIVPGKWSQSDLRFQARQVASMVAHNASFNCSAAQVLVTAKGWQQREAFLHELKIELAKIPPRPAYYPGAEQRYQAFLDRYPQAQVISPSSPISPLLLPWVLIPNVPPQAEEYALQEEAFCGVLAETSLEVTGAGDFLSQVGEFVNQHVWGNLSCVLLVDPLTQKQYAEVLDTTIANLRYGTIGINVWTGVAYSLYASIWGAFPGNSLHDIQSGRGVVHNTYFFEHPQKAVVSAPFRLRPTPLWFVNHPNLLQAAQCFTTLQANPTWGNFLRVVLAAVKG